MSGRRRSNLAPSLFPFLAVLVCTLGTLILLLALVAQNASTAAAAEAEQKQAAAKAAAPKVAPKPTGMTRAEAVSMIDESKFRVEQLVMIRDQQTADIERRREQMTQVESHMAKIRAELKRLSAEVDLATGEKKMTSTDESQLQALAAKLESEQEALIKLRQEKQNQKPRVAIIPHKGPNGTDRRPVYVECTTDGVTIWPEECKITFAQLQESVSGANPLDAALRVVRHHALQNYGDSVAPYPMLVVRPDGIETYAVARATLHEWDDQFGYELVPADVDLAYDTPDRQLKSRVLDAIHSAVIRQHGLNALAKRASQSYGGSVSGDRRIFPRLSASAMDRRGRASGFEDHREGFGQRSAYAAQQRSAMNYQSHSGSSTGADFARDFDQHLRDAASELNANGENDGSTNGSLTNNPFHLDPSSKSSSASSSDRAAGGKGNEQGIQGGTARMRGTDKLADSQNDTSNQPSQDNARTNLFLSPIVPQEAVVRSEQNPFMMPGTDGQFSGSAGQTNPSARSGSQGSTSHFSQPAGGNPNVGQSSRQNSASVQSSPSSASQSQPQNSQSTSATITRELVKRSGANWALPRSIAHTQGNAIVRTIRVQCYPNRMVLIPPASGGATEMFGLADDDMNRATIELASAVRDRIQRWGAAIPGGRWQPRLDVEVMPGGEQRFYQLQRLMSGSGVDVEGRASQPRTQP